MLEHRQSNGSGLFDESMSSFFRNVDTRSHPPVDIPLARRDGSANPIASLKARAVLVDMEEGVLDSLMNRHSRGLGDLFDERQTVHSVSGSGNNWAHGHCHYGREYGASILEAVRRQTEHCESLQAFLFMHSLGGGTGSGLGTYILGELQDAYPDIYRFVTAVFPSDQDDVVTSPYNSILSLAQLVEHADAVMPIHNQALMDICAKINKPKPGSKEAAAAAAAAGASGSSSSSSAAPSSSTSGSLIDLDPRASRQAQKAQKRAAFDDMNTLAAQLLTSLTCSMRFEGPLNVDLNEITMNLVPFPRMHFLVSSLAPLYTTNKENQALKFGGASLSGASSDPRMSSSGSTASSSSSAAAASASALSASKGIDGMFSSLFRAESHLVKVSPKTQGLYLACGVFGRGPDLTVSDLTRNIARMKARREVRLMAWNEDGFKIGLCSAPPVGMRNSLLGLANSSAVAPVMSSMRERCLRMYTRRANFHHYLEYMEPETMDAALRTVESVILDYTRLENQSLQQEEAEIEAAQTIGAQRMRPLG